MTTLYALLAGIDHYRAAEVPDLQGCVNDVRAARDHLDATLAPGTRLDATMLLDHQATRRAVIEAIRTHLGQAGPGDVALFWFSGHGSEAPAPRWATVLEATGMVQTLVCADSRTAGTPDLWDKELSVLLDDVADRAGHVVAVLDSCHSEGATRELREREPAARVRSIAAAGPRSLDSVLPRALERAAGPPVEHVLLAACRSAEAAQELPLDSGIRGVFSWSLLRALRQLGPAATYRDLMWAARTEVEMRSSRQVPQALPRGSALLDRQFLGGAASAPASGIRMRYTREGWMIDAGAVHGVPAGAGTRVGVRGGAPGREAEVVEVRTEQSRVEPAGGWAPSRDRQFPVVVTSVPLPPTTVAVDGENPDAVRALREALTGSVLVRTLGPTDPTVPDLRMTVTDEGRLTFTDQHGDTLEERRYGGTHAVADAVSTLGHIARWRLIRQLENPVSALAGSVRVEIVEAEPGVGLIPLGGRLLRPDENGEYVVHYRPTEQGWAPPEVFVRLRNTWHSPLYCVLLDLTPRFKVDATLFPGDVIAPGATGSCLRGRRIKAFLPPGTPARPGVRIRDRLKVLVAEQQFGVEPFLLPSLGNALETRSVLSASGLLERLGGRVTHRDLGAPELPTGYDWSTTEVTLTTVVP